MYTFEKSTYIERPPSDVFDFVTNPSNASSWQSGVESAGWTSAGTG
jgi:carbon monoxide dehydrogenase subunit G